MASKIKLPLSNAVVSSGLVKRIPSHIKSNPGAIGSKNASLIIMVVRINNF